jgi:hypothetical protein
MSMMGLILLFTATSYSLSVIIEKLVFDLFILFLIYYQINIYMHAELKSTPFAIETSFIFRQLN